MIKGSFYIMSAKLLGYGVRLVLPFFLVRLLTVADFGAYRQFFLLDVYIATLFQFGLNQALYYFIPRDPRNGGAYFVNSLWMNIVIFAVAFTIIGTFRQQISSWLNMPILGNALPVLAAYTSMLILTTACDCYLTARQRIRASATFEIGGQVLVSIATVGAAWMTRDLMSVLQALVVARCLQLVAMLSFIHWRLHGFRAERYFSGLGEQVRYGMILGIGGTFGTMLLRLHDFFVSRYYGTEVYAVYSVGCTEIPIIQIFTQSVAMVALGKFAAMDKSGDWDGVAKLWDRVLTSTYAITIPVVAVLLLVARPLVVLMFTEAYEAAVPIFRVNTLLKLSLLFNATLVLRAMNRNGVTVWVNAIAMAVSPFVLYAGMKLGGLVGIIGAQAVLMVLSRLVPVFILNRSSPVPLPYIPSFGQVWLFYREIWDGARHRLRLRRGGSLG